MSRTRKDTNKGGQRDRHLSVRAVRRDPPDYRKLSRALIDLAMAQAEADATAQQRPSIAVETPAAPENTPDV